MNNLCLEMTLRSTTQKTVGSPLTTDKTEPSLSIHDSVIVSTLVVKEQGENLLIKLPKATTLACRTRYGIQYFLRSRMYLLSIFALPEKICRSVSLLCMNCRF